MTTPPTNEQLAEWKKLCEEATEGPWEKLRGGIHTVDTHPRSVRSLGKAVGSGGYCRSAIEIFINSDCDCQPCSDIEVDKDFITASRTALPALIEEVERLRGNALMYYQADGEVDVLASASEVRDKRQQAARHIASLEAQCVRMTETLEWIRCVGSEAVSSAANEALARLDSLRQGGRG